MFLTRRSKEPLRQGMLRLVIRKPVIRSHFRADNQSDGPMAKTGGGGLARQY
jgi:hypothetical protein